ncbi:DUF368 domain-containing protein [Corynebacterium alimapuense]|uniref:DUF368 domain-containing protein n=1 Tax=Corynebacterium alimapuense TaxID=1576874 RepID=A0A3M8K512_9CORY|nr:DUF368 domain-containing protein [Corynebacterium alimapuense]RNE48313.1 DUF368 domain-containing protein [Corynebacterium alimapuense]
MSTDLTHPTPTSRTPMAVILNVIRGALIGLAELVPGISGGTVALVVGIYERALHAADMLFRRKFSEVDWFFLISVAVGMVTAVFTLSTVLHDFVDNSPEYARGLFLGMVAVSIWVPVAMMDHRELRNRWMVVVPLFLAAVGLSFLGTGFSSTTQTDPSLIVIFLAASVVVCALVLPGVSGSFLLLTMGLYSPVLAAVSDRDWVVIFTFIAGAAVGIALFVRMLSYAMKNHRTLTLTVMAGFMLGSLRALWPWQSSTSELLAPGDNLWAVFGMTLIGALVVLSFIIADRVASARRKATVIEEEASAS